MLIFNVLEYNIIISMALINEEKLVLNENKIVFSKLIFICLPLFLFILYFNLSSIYLISALIIFSLAFIFLKNKLWIFLIFAIPTLIFGQIAKIPVTSSWVYEASISELIILGIVIIFIMDKFINGKIRKIKIDWLAVGLFLYLVAAIFSYFEIINFRLYIFSLKLISLSFMAYFLGHNLINSKKKINLFFISLSVMVLALSGQIFFKVYQLGLTSRLFLARNTIIIPIGPLAIVVAILAMILPIMLALYFNSKNDNKFKFFFLIVFILGAIAVFLTLGKAAIGSLAVALFYLFLKLKNKRVVLLLSFLLLASVGYLIFSPFIASFIDRLSNTFVDVNSRWRVTEYKIGWKIIKEHLIFGVGSGQQLEYYKKILFQEDSQLVNNFILQAAIDLGLIGLTAIGFIFFTVFKKIREINKNKLINLTIASGFTATFIVAFVNGLLEVTFFSIAYGVTFWMIFGVYSNLKNYEEINSHNN
jgi:hypothetical protein